MKLDLDALERVADDDAVGGLLLRPQTVADLVRIARAAVAWRIAWSPRDGQSSHGRSLALLDALREAGL